VAKDVVDSAL